MCVFGVEHLWAVDGVEDTETSICSHPEVNSTPDGNRDTLRGDGVPFVRSTRPSKYVTGGPIESLGDDANTPANSTVQRYGMGKSRGIQ